MKNWLQNLFCKKQRNFRIKIIAQSTNTPTLDCPITDLMDIQQNVHGNNEYIFKGNGADLVISEIK